MTKPTRPCTKCGAGERHEDYSLCEYCLNPPPPRSFPYRFVPGEVAERLTRGRPLDRRSRLSQRMASSDQFAKIFGDHV